VYPDEPSNLPTPSPEGQVEAGAPRSPSLVVGVGASAGGLEAFKELLGVIPTDAGLSFLFVAHVAPTQPTLLAEVLRQATPLTVLDARQDLRIEPNHIYVIPPNALLGVRDGFLHLLPRAPRRILHMPADHLFRSLAEDLKSAAVGVVLSGGGTDGTLGLAAIKAEGGITFAQDERSARHDSMPRSAIAEVHVDYVLPPAEIGRQLLRLADHSYARTPVEAVPGPEVQSALDQILGLVRVGTAVDFSQYKRTTVLRRIQRRMALRGLESLEEYLACLQENSPEVQGLYQDLLIRVTRFFRDEATFDALKAEVFPKLLKDRSPNAPLRVWVAGCSTGEEVYSLAICLLEFLGERNLNFPVKLLATDVNDAALERARAGVYVDNIELDVSPERLRRFFAQADGHYQIGKVVRDLCIFSRHNLTSDPPFSRLDLVSCRNVLIYLDAALQKRVMPRLHYSLNPGGYLLLGSSESIGTFGELFAVVDQKNRIYARNAVGSPSLALDFGTYVEKAGLGPRPPAHLPPAWSALDVQKEADRVVLSKYAPVGVVIDENMTVLQFRGRTGSYLEPAPGAASLDLLKMVREGLLGEVRAAVGRARLENAAVRKEGIPIREKHAFRTVNVEVIPIKVPPSGLRCFVVLFEDAAAPPADRPAPAPPPTAEAIHLAAEQQVSLLQQELAATREYLQSLVEEHESACEELKSASEELLSANEELQSTNEELQTAKEETQSANEELATLNEELHHRNLELAQANNDLVNLLAAVQIPIVLVSRDLRIRRFTPLAEKLLNLIPTDVGRPISDIKPNLEVPDFAERIAGVIDTLLPQETAIQDCEGHWYSLRIRPYVTLDNKIEGASITLVDVDSLRRSLALRPPARPGLPTPAGDGPARPGEGPDLSGTEDASDKEGPPA
jgi:two-component system CheB/CheR fusion protein